MKTLQMRQIWGEEKSIKQCVITRLRIIVYRDKHTSLISLCAYKMGEV